MKKTLRTLMLGMMTLLAGSALTSCSNDEEPQAAQQEGQKGYVEFTLTRGADTRTTYEANDKGGLDVTWSEDDKVVVSYNDGEIVEVFSIVDGAETTTATFAKEKSDLAKKTGTVILKYIPGFDDESKYDEYVFDFSKQSGSLKDFAAYDYFTFSATLTNGKITEPKYQPAMAVYHFKAKDIDFGVSSEYVDFFFGMGVKSISKNVDLTGYITVQGISLTGGKLDEDLYVAVYSSQAPTTLTVGSKTFELPTENLVAGKMYTFAQENLKDATPLTIEALAKGTITINNPLGITISYSFNGLARESKSTNPIKIEMTAGDRVKLYGDNATYAKSIYSNYTNITCSGNSKVYGNIMSLINSENYSSLKELPTTDSEGNTVAYTFACLFEGNKGLTDVSGLILPAETLRESCYSYMFSDCTKLTEAPALPAKILAKECYRGMFASCYKLTSAPELPATTLADGCYYDMFEKCTSLTAGPALPATTLAEKCYYEMFEKCTLLTEAPALPAKTLAKECYRGMFVECSSLKSVTCLATDISAYSCIFDWLSKVDSPGTFTKAASMESWPTGASGIPSGWTVKNY